MSATRRGARLLYRRVLALSFVVMASGCAMAPAQEMSDARLALQAARDAGAERLSGEWLLAAGGELAEAEQAIASQHFDAARQHAQMARGLALAARNTALLAVAPDRAALPSTQARAATAALIDASRRAVASGDMDKAVMLAEEAVRISATAAAAKGSP